MILASDCELNSRQQQALATKARIGEVALQLFSEQGFAATSTRQIAQAAEVSEGLIFRYFPTKLELLHSIAETRPTVASEVRTVLDEAQDEPAESCLRAVADAFMRMARSEMPFLNMMFGESRTNDDLYALFRRFTETTSDALAAYLDKRVAAGELRADLATESAARAFFGSLIFFFLTNKHLSDEEWQARAQTYQREVLEVWLKGVQNNS